jgi:ubiquinone/menaquinone biosynthesis C-methylase UbiE
MGLGHSLLRQCGKPTGWLGRLQLWNMNRRHAAVTQWGLSHVSFKNHGTLLDVGCGGGATITRLAALAREGKVYGVDYSEASVKAARKTNQQLIVGGRVEVLRAGVSHLPFPDRTFHLVTAVETHYYWPDLAADLRELLRVLKPAGTLVLIAEAYKGGKYDRLLRRLEALERLGIMRYAHLTLEEHRSLLVAAGYSEVQVFEDYERGWICATGVRPEDSRIVQGVA